MKEQKSEWDNSYVQMDIMEGLLNINKKSPENFIDDIKLEYLRLPENGIIIEIGAGSGKLLTRIGIINDKYRLIGLDYSYYSSVLIRENIMLFNLNGTSICGDVFHLPFKSNIVNVVLSGGLLEHFNESEIDKVIGEMVRILKPNGIFYADIAPKKISLLRPIILTEQGGYENSFNKKHWLNILNRNNLCCIGIFSGLVLPPNFYGWFKSGLMLSIVYKLKSFIMYFDNTWLSDILGFEYFVFARKES